MEPGTAPGGGRAGILPALRGRVPVLLNARAGSVRSRRRRELEEELGGPLRAAGVDCEFQWVVPRGFTSAARAQIAQGAAALFVAGGDGTLATVAAELAGGDVPLGVLPLGTHNHFARDLGLPLEPAAAAAALARGARARVDLGEVNGRYFLNTSSVGLYTRVLREREDSDLPRKAASVVGGVLALAAFGELDLSLEVRGEVVQRRCALLLVGNGQHHLRPPGVPFRHTLTGGQLHVHIAMPRNRLDLLRMMARGIAGGADHPRIEHFEAKRLLVRSSHRHIDMALDGDLKRVEAPLSYRIHTASLPVIVP